MKTIIMKTILILLLVTVACFARDADGADAYMLSKTLQPSVLTLLWNYNSTTITGELRAVNMKWIIFGIQATTTEPVDWIVAWLNKDTGLGHFSDRYSLKNSTYLIQKDQQTNWLPLDVFYEGSTLVVKFSRPIVRCDPTNQDVDIKVGAMIARYAYGADPATISSSENINIQPDRFNSMWMNVELIPQSASSSVNLNCPTPKVAPAFTSQPTGTYTNSVDLAPSQFKFFWNFTQTSITGEVHVKTSGWVGFGLSPDGGMYNSDVMIGWITNDGLVNFTDRHINGEGAVLVDAHQDWQLLSSREKDGYTMFKFTRLIKTCDSEDRDIENGSPHVIFAWGDADPAPGSDITYHGFSNRGTLGVLLISNSVNDEEPLPKNMQKLQFSFDGVILPKVDTYYYNEIQKLPDLPKKMHILKQELEFSDINFANMHHVNIFECQNYNGTPSIAPGDSTTNNIFDIKCQSHIGGWAVGGVLSETFPKNTGIPIGGPESDYSHVRLEIHYNNPNLDFAYIDKFTMTFYVTTELRKYDLGTLMLGTGVDAVAIAVPPEEETFNLTTYCYNSCLRSRLQTQNINIIRAFPHTHLTGVKVSTRLVRDGVDMGLVYENPYYDFNFQQTYTLYPPVVITPKDELITKCVYRTIGKTNITYGGFGTKNEMCLQYLTYYPKMPNFRACLTIPDIGDLYDMLDGLNKTGDIKLPTLTDPDLIYPFINNELIKLNERSSSPKVKLALKRFYMDYNTNSLCDGHYDDEKRAPIVAKSSSVVTDDSCSQKPQGQTIFAKIAEFISKVVNSVRDFFKKLFSW